MSIAAFEEKLRILLKGEHSSLTLSFNDGCGPNYMTVAQEEEEGLGFGDWVSEDERGKAIATNSKWILQWYPDTPIGFYAVAASSIQAIMNSLEEQP